jgi:hypothetical protein
VSCLLFTGIVFGFANLRLVLERDGQFQELCNKTTIVSNITANTTAEDLDLGVCKAQDNRFNLMYTIATCTVAMMGLPAGMFIDRFGPTKSALLSLTLVVASLFGIGHLRSTEALIPCFAVLGAAGFLTFLGSFPISFLVGPAMQPLLLTVVNCAFDASSAVFLIFDQIHRTGNISRKQLFDGYAVLAAVVLGTVALLWHKVQGKPNKEVENNDGSSGGSINSKSIVDTNAEAEAKAKEGKADSPTAGVGYPTYHTDSVRVQMRTFEYFVSVVFVCVHLLRSNTYLGKK